jgi:hypothetical protein
VTFQTLLVIVAIMIGFMAWYANNSKRNQILCTFNRVNKTQVVKFIKMQSRYVVFDKCKYDIVPDRVVFRWFNSGIVYMLFPQFIPCLTFSHTSRWPLNPNTNLYTAESPEVRETLNKEEWFKSFNKSASPQGKGVKAGFSGMIMQWLPIIAIVLVIGVFIYFNGKLSDMGHSLDAVIGKLNSVIK